MSSFRQDFPTLRSSKGVYLDSACQSLKPDCVIQKILEYYNEYPACGGRSIHSMATKVSVEIDKARDKLATFFGCNNSSEFVFTKGTTEGMNIIARGFGLKKGDTVVTLDIEHNSNHVQWLDMATNVGIKRKYCKTSPNGEFEIEEFKKTIDKNVRLVSMGQTSNITGCSIPVKEIVEIAHDNNIAVAIDGAQAAPHQKVNLKDLDVDFYCASLHKMLGPTGVGFMYGKSERLKNLHPLIMGGGMVSLTTYNLAKISNIPERFEAGLGNYSGIIGSSIALEYLTKIGMENIEKHEHYLQKLIQKEVEDIKRLFIIGPKDPMKRGGVFSFNIEGLRSHDVAMMLDSMDNIMIRSGMHCVHPYFLSKKINGSARASVYLYNNEEDIARFTTAIKKIAQSRMP
ncbi:MAG: aminotransferase class V-fold PLP-dependent enzyme [archaeon]|nr:aminotransferase class V-fold PLP-dependent enzyme [archaeon]